MIGWVFGRLAVIGWSVIGRLAVIGWVGRLVVIGGVSGFVGCDWLGSWLSTVVGCD